MLTAQNVTRRTGELSIADAMRLQRIAEHARQRLATKQREEARLAKQLERDAALRLARQIDADHAAYIAAGSPEYEEASA